MEPLESLSELGTSESSEMVFNPEHVKNICSGIVAKLQGSGASSNVI